MKIVQILIIKKKVLPVNSEVSVRLNNIESPEHVTTNANQMFVKY